MSENYTQTELNEFVSLKCGFPETVHAILNGVKTVTIDGVYTLPEKLSVDRIVFLTLGGDTGKKDVDWKPGFRGIAHVVKAPYDHGYSGKDKYFKFDISIDVLLPLPMKRENFINYEDAFDAAYIGPELARDPSQAVSTLEYNKAVAVVRAALDMFPHIKENIESTFDEIFCSKVFAPIKMLLPQMIGYGEITFTEGHKVLMPGESNNSVDLDTLRQEWMSKENQDFILACLDFMKLHGLFTENTLATLQSKEKCAALFRHNSMNGILQKINPSQPKDEQRKDANGNSRYYSEQYVIGNDEYLVSSEWRADREDARKPLIDWIFALMQEIKFNTGYQSEFPRNRILFGAPGTGKSFTLNHEKDLLLAEGGEYERVTFHPDYSYANFVGTYKPVPCKDSDGKDAITYSYVPGPFMRTYVKALQNSRTDAPKPFLLVIEEINRANVAAVFGDVFQLLDRGDDEVSEYPIQASEDIKKYLAGELGGTPDDYAEIRIPDNMFIWATMNSADQGVFPMDTAFKRRWDFTYLGIDDSEAGIVGKKVILGQGDYRRIVEWNALRKAINEELLTYKVNEDKLMGPYFISKKNLPEGEMIDPAVFTRIFKNKVIMYLFDDAAKQKRITLFGGCDEKAKNQYSKICREFDTKGVYIFCEGISSQFIDNVPEDDGE